MIQVIFENPHWETVISNAVASVCAVLEINKATATPRYELHKLMLYETGSQYEVSFPIKPYLA